MVLLPVSILSANCCWLENRFRLRADLTALIWSGATLSDLDDILGDVDDITQTLRKFFHDNNFFCYPSKLITSQAFPITSQAKPKQSLDSISIFDNILLELLLKEYGPG